MPGADQPIATLFDDNWPPPAIKPLRGKKFGSTVKEPVERGPHNFTRDIILNFALATAFASDGNSLCSAKLLPIRITGSNATVRQARPGAPTDADLDLKGQQSYGDFDTVDTLGRIKPLTGSMKGFDTTVTSAVLRCRLQLAVVSA